MNKSELFAAFERQIAQRAIQLIDGEWEIVGKWCRIQRMGEKWDLFICNPSDMYNGLGQRKVNNIIRALIDDGVIVHDPESKRWRATAGIESITIPDTIQGVIMARIDR